MTATTAGSGVGSSVDEQDRRFGIAALVLAVLTLVLFARSPETATFDLNLGSPTLELPDLVLPVAGTAVVLAALMVAIGLLQLLRGTDGHATLALGVVLGAFVFAFLTWSAGGTDLNLLALLRGTIRGAVPLALGALSGVVCERAGVINIAIEGQFLIAAFLAAVVASVAGPVLGLGAAALGAVLFAAILAVMSIRYRADQIIVGVTLVVLGSGLTAFLVKLLPSSLNAPQRFDTLDVPVLGAIPIIGPVLFDQSVIVYLMFAAVALVTWLLFSTRWGLRVRAVGEKPAAADTVGISVAGVRYQAVLLGGVLAGVGGAYFTLDSAAQFSREMSAGRGFIALAAMLVGRYHPVGALGAALVFGFAEALATSLSLVGVPIPSNLLLTAPYLATILVVAGIVGRVRMPAADGQPYTTE